MKHEHGIEWKRLARIALAMSLLGAGAVACGDDDDDDGGGAGSAAGTGGSTAGSGGSTAGSGGSTAGSGGSTAGTGGAGGSTAMTIMCGTATCMGGTIQGMAAMPCCDTDSGNICGLQVDPMNATACEGTGQMGTDDADCPSAMSVAGTTLAGCCNTATNMCGVRSMALMGCIERTDYPTNFLMMVGGMAPPPLAAMDCEGDADGGI